MKYERKIPIDLECGVTIYDIMIGGKWKLYLINCMNRCVKRPSEFQRLIPGATKRLLQQQLNEMERMRLVTKEVLAEVHVRVEYSLTDRGCSLIPIIRLMDAWGFEHSHLFAETRNLKEKLQGTSYINVIYLFLRAQVN